MHIISVFSFQSANQHLKKKRSSFLFLSQAFVRYVDIDKETQRAAVSILERAPGKIGCFLSLL